MPTLKSKIKSTQLTIGITLGDPNSIGPEVTVKALRNPEINSLAKFIVIGDASAYRHYQKRNIPNVEFLDVKRVENFVLDLGNPTIASGRASLAYLDKAVELLKTKKINALVTAPLSKEMVAQVHPGFHGHTEFLAAAFSITRFGMMFIGDSIKTLLVTRHIPLNKVSDTINTENILETIILSEKALREYFNAKNPCIAVCGLNPHAGEGGLLGAEEQEKIIPAIEKARKQGIYACGPFAADTLFVPQNSAGFDCIIAMYHDQGLIPVKMAYFQNLVNLTVGLPFVRTSPAHGTAFDIAGKDRKSVV